jgi:hypothetical protein
MIFREAAQHSVHLTGGYAPRFQAFSLAQGSSVKMVLSHPSRQQVTPAVGLFLAKQRMEYDVLQEKRRHIAT